MKRKEHLPDHLGSVAKLRTIAEGTRWEGAAERAAKKPRNHKKTLGLRNPLTHLIDRRNNIKRYIWNQNYLFLSPRSPQNPQTH